MKKIVFMKQCWQMVHPGQAQADGIRGGGVREEPEQGTKLDGRARGSCMQGAVARHARASRSQAMLQGRRFGKAAKNGREESGKVAESSRNREKAAVFMRGGGSARLGKQIGHGWVKGWVNLCQAGNSEEPLGGGEEFPHGRSMQGNRSGFAKAFVREAR